MGLKIQGKLHEGHLPVPLRQVIIGGEPLLDQGSGDAAL